MRTPKLCPGHILLVLLGLSCFAQPGIAQSPPPPIISTIAGGPLPSGVSATSVGIGPAAGIVSDGAGGFYFSGEAAIYRVSAVGILTRFAGTGVSGFSGDGGPAIAAELTRPGSLALDSSGNVFVLDDLRVRKITTAGVISTVAGSGVQGFAGDGGPATSAQFSFVNGLGGIAVDTAGSLFIADSYNSRIRKVAAGTINTVAGTGAYAFSGDSGPATSAGLGYPLGVAVDATGNLYIADTNNSRIRKVTTAGVISTVAGTGNGVGGDGGQATAAGIGFVQFLSFDGAGNLYISQGGQNCSCTTHNNRVRKITTGGIISTVAGTGDFGYGGDGGPATAALLDVMSGMVADPSGNLLIVDFGNRRIRKVASGVIDTVAGNGFFYFRGDGGPAVSAQLDNPGTVAVDAAGNIFVADVGNYRVRKITPAGDITTVAGTGFPGFSGDGGPAVAARLGSIQGIAVDAAGNLFVAGDSRIRKITPAGIITTFAGASLPVNGANALTQVLAPLNVVADPAGGFYVASGQHQIYHIAADGTLTVIAGTGAPGFSGDGGPATLAELGELRGLVRDASGNLFVAEYLKTNTSFSPFNDYVATTRRIRKITAGGVISTVGAFSTVMGYQDGAGLALDSAGDFYVADTGGGVIRKVTSGGTVTIVAGGGTLYGPAGNNMPATSALLFQPTSVAVDSSGNLYIGDIYYVRKVTTSGTITTIAGNGFSAASGDGGPATSAGLAQCLGIAVDGGGNIYVAEIDGFVRKFTVGGIISTVAGNGAYVADYDPVTQEGVPAVSASLSTPVGLAIDASGNLLIADTGNGRVRKVVSDGTISTAAASGPAAGFSGDGGPATSARLDFPSGMAIDAAGNLFFADSYRNRVRKITALGVITTVAGSGVDGFSGDGGPALSASLDEPTGVAVDSGGNLFISDTSNDRVRKVTQSSGVITTFAGTGVEGFFGDGGPATSAELNGPGGMAIDAAGNLFFADSDNNRIRRVDTAGIITTVAGTGAYGFSGDGGPATSAALYSPTGLAVDGAGNLIIADSLNNRIRKIANVVSGRRLRFQLVSD